MRPLTPSSRIFLYVIYGIALTTVLLYVRFPAEKFKLFCEQKVERSIKSSDCIIKSIHYSFPTSVILEDVQITTSSGEQQSLFKIDQFRLRPGLQFWKTFKLFGDVYSGTFRSTVRLNHEKKSYKLTDTVVSGINLANLLKDQGLVDRKVTGSLSGSGQYSAQWNKSTTGEGKWRVEIQSGQMEFLQPILSLASIEFSRINADISTGRDFTVQEGKLKGKDLNANFEGNVDIQDFLLASRVRISGQLEPNRQFLQSHPVEAKMVKQYAKRYKKSALPFKLRGTVAKPTFRFGR